MDLECDDCMSTGPTDMISYSRLILAACLGLLASCQQLTPADVDSGLASATIGTVALEKDGAMNVMLRAEDTIDGQPVAGDAMFHYTRRDKEYWVYMRHVGGLKKGESKLIPPFPKTRSFEPSSPATSLNSPQKPGLAYNRPVPQARIASKSWDW